MHGPDGPYDGTSECTARPGIISAGPHESSLVWRDGGADAFADTEGREGCVGAADTWVNTDTDADDDGDNGSWEVTRIEISVDCHSLFQRLFGHALTV